MMVFCQITVATVWTVPPRAVNDWMSPATAADDPLKSAVDEWQPRARQATAASFAVLGSGAVNHD